jgi:ferric-dicitrate binding protein FerR (iron transport regulator)
MRLSSRSRAAPLADAPAAQAAWAEAEQRMEAERRAFQASISSLGGGGAQATAAWKQRVAALRAELQAACAERDRLRLQCQPH